MDKYAYCQGYNISFLTDLTLKSSYRPLIENIINLTNCKYYLELGVENPQNLDSIRNLVYECIGVDIVDFGEIEGFYNRSTDDFFKQNEKKFDIIFIDADHRFEQVITDFENSLAVLNEFGIIIFHDTDPIHQELLQDKFCSDSYKIIDYIYLNHPELNVITLPIHETGMSLVMRRKDRRINKQI